MLRLRMSSITIMADSTLRTLTYHIIPDNCTFIDNLVFTSTKHGFQPVVGPEMVVDL